MLIKLMMSCLLIKLMMVSISMLIKLMVSCLLIKITLPSVLI